MRYVITASLLILASNLQAAPVPKATEVYHKIMVEQTLENKLRENLKVFLGTDDVITSVKVTLRSTRIRTVSKKQEFALPGVPVDAELTKKKVIKIRQRMGNISATVIVGVKLTRERMADVRKITVDLLGLDVARGDTVSIESMAFTKRNSPEAAVMEEMKEAPWKAFTNPEGFRTTIFFLAALFLLTIFFFGPLRVFLKKAGQGFENRGGEGGGMDSVPALNLPGPTGPLMQEPTGPMQTAPASADAANQSQNGKPFSYITADKIQHLSYLLNDQSSEQIAIVVSYLNVDMATQMLHLIKQEKREEVLLKLGKRKLIQSKDVEHLSEVIKKHIDFVVGGEDKLSGILNMESPEEQERFLENLEYSNPDLAGYLKGQILTLDQIFHMDKTQLQKLLWEAHRQKISLGALLQLTNDETREIALSLLPDGIKPIVQEELNTTFNGSLKPNKERKRFLVLAKHMQKEGLLSL